MPLNERDIRVLWISMDAFEGFERLFTLNRSGGHFACEPLCLVAINCSVISPWVNMRGYCNGFVLTYQIDLRSSWGFFFFLSSPPLHLLTLITGEKRSRRLCCAGFLCTQCVAEKSKKEKSALKKINQPALNWINKANNYVADLKDGLRPPCCKPPNSFDN